jgi:tRNA threonylcarbamoyladenosine biosynthesis protein TsaE
MPENIRIITRSPEETMALAERLGGILSGRCLVALIGDLGAGKTIFVKGLAKGLGVKDHNYVNSPSFVVVKEYYGRVPLYHFDVYRLCGKLFCETMDYERYFYSEAVSAVEWADKIPELLPEEYIEVGMKYGDGDERVITFRAVGKNTGKLLAGLIKPRS